MAGHGTIFGQHEDPRLKGRRPDLSDQVTLPNVLIQPHSAPLGITFYEGDQFPKEYRGDAFVTLHGSRNRARRTGYKVIRLRFANGKPTGEYRTFSPASSPRMRRCGDGPSGSLWLGTVRSWSARMATAQSGASPTGGNR